MDYVLNLSSSSSTWKRMLQVRHLAKPHIRWVIGEGNIDVYKDKWLNSALTPTASPLTVKNQVNNVASPLHYYVEQTLV